MSTLRVNTIQNVAGSGDPAINGAAKAWVNFNGTGTVAIRASFNVSSITDHGTGEYTVNFTNALTDTNYSVSCGFAGVNGLNGIVFYPATKYVGVQYDSTYVSTSSIRCLLCTGGGAATDGAYLNVSVFR